MHCTKRGVQGPENSCVHCRISDKSRSITDQIQGKAWFRIYVPMWMYDTKVHFRATAICYRHYIDRCWSRVGTELFRQVDLQISQKDWEPLVYNGASLLEILVVIFIVGLLDPQAKSVGNHCSQVDLQEQDWKPLVYINITGWSLTLEILVGIFRFIVDLQGPEAKPAGKHSGQVDLQEQDWEPLVYISITG